MISRRRVTTQVQEGLLNRRKERYNKIIMDKNELNLFKPESVLSKNGN